MSVADFTARIEDWCTTAGLTVTGRENHLAVDRGEAGTTDLRISVGRVWLVHRIPFEDTVEDAVANNACRLVNLSRSGVIQARWRGHHVELVADLTEESCTSESLFWLFAECDVIAGRLKSRLGT